jgi:hypothetical protein
VWISQAMNGSGSSVTSASQGLIENRMTAVITIISTSVAKVERVQRQEHADAVGLGADARHQVAGALAAEVFQRQAQQVLEGGGAQVGADALGHQRQDVGARPAQAPGHSAEASRPDRGTAVTPAWVSMGWPFWNGISTSSISGMVR